MDKPEVRLMTKNHNGDRKRSLLYLALVLLAGFALVVCLLLVFYRPLQGSVQVTRLRNTIRQLAHLGENSQYVSIE